MPELNVISTLNISYFMINKFALSISQVHRRPIMWKSEAPTELPSDFPSVSNAKPDTGSDTLEFRSQQSPDISGKNDFIARMV